MASAMDPKNLRSVHRQFYFVVHTQTNADVEGYVCGGGLDLGLNEAGMEEARKLARRFKRNPLKLKRMVASPELRCIQMADILHDEMKMKLSLSRDFADQFLGEWEGKPFTKEMNFEKPPMGESASAFSIRVNVGLEKIFQENLLTVLVIHHRVAEEILKGMGLAGEKVMSGVMYVIDLPVEQGKGHLREV